MHLNKTLLCMLVAWATAAPQQRASSSNDTHAELQQAPTTMTEWPSYMPSEVVKNWPSSEPLPRVVHTPNTAEHEIGMVPNVMVTPPASIASLLYRNGTNAKMTDPVANILDTSYATDFVDVPTERAATATAAAVTPVIRLDAMPNPIAHHGLQRPQSSIRQPGPVQSQKQRQSKTQYQPQSRPQPRPYYSAKAHPLVTVTATVTQTVTERATFTNIVYGGAPAYVTRNMDDELQAVAQPEMYTVISPVEAFVQSLPEVTLSEVVTETASPMDRYTTKRESGNHAAPTPSTGKYTFGIVTSGTLLPEFTDKTTPRKMITSRALGIDVAPMVVNRRRAVVEGPPNDAVAPVRAPPNDAVVDAANPPPAPDAVGTIILPNPGENNTPPPPTGVATASSPSIPLMSVSFPNPFKPVSPTTTVVEDIGASEPQEPPASGLATSPTPAVSYDTGNQFQSIFPTPTTLTMAQQLAAPQQQSADDSKGAPVLTMVTVFPTTMVQTRSADGAPVTTTDLITKYVIVMEHTRTVRRAAQPTAVAKDNTNGVLAVSVIP